MCEDVARAGNPNRVGFVIVALAGLAYVFGIVLPTVAAAQQRFRRVPREWSEDICADNNFDFLQYQVAPLPQAAQPDF
jgi:hypothetical protein